ncbi:hypothetical protein GCM10027275_15530 [Rhabdobacter roseus]|uniref:Lipopolysaccharide biosynthesis protein n=1 Tax=Rhabdobacter roseus TaxID=1655419 RepID=A0A840TQF7_9BACT|nr:hypothetical protein [Rhabdobacter roseus]MBB5283473.1 hypothetical protein [Rhabdobacter roseus]
MSQQVTHTIPEDQISPKTVIIKIIAIKDVLIKNWLVIVLFTLAGFGIGLALDIFLRKPDKYQATVLFNLGASQGPGGFGEMAGLLGLGASPDANIFTGENFLYFVKSRPVIERALMKEVDVEGKKMLMANFYIDSSSIREIEWLDNPKRENFHFTKSDPKEFTLDEQMALNDIVLKAQVATEIYQPDRKSSFTMLATSFESAPLAKIWATTLLDTVEEVYTENQTFKTRKTLRLLENRADSLARILGSQESRLARELDYSQQLIIPEARISATRLERNASFIQRLYVEAMTSAENMRVSLVREAPLFTIIEPVKNPLDRETDKGKRAQIGFLIGLVLSLVFVYAKSTYQTIMADPRY